MDDLLLQALWALQANAPPNGEPYYGCFSGGKDSEALKEMARLAGVPVEWYYNQTTIDPPELVRHIREHHPDVTWLKPKHGNFFRRVIQRGHIPTRLCRWCCSEYKERRPPKGVTMLMGIRAEESVNRANNWQIVGTHRNTRRGVVLPLLEWDSEFLWDFLRDQKIPTCSLYQEGFTRLGCVGCPLAARANRLREFRRWPLFEKQWRRAIRSVYEQKTGTLQRNGKEWFGSALFDSWEDMWDWWVMGRSLPNRRG